MTVVAGAYFAAHLWAQTTPPTGGGQPPPQTRVAFINIAKILQDYKKAQDYKQEIEKIIEPKKKERDKLVNEIAAWKKVMEADPKFKPGAKEFDAKEYERY